MNNKRKKMLLSTTEQAFLSQAAAESLKSKLMSKHGCIAVANGKILGRGHNSSRTQSSDGFICNTCSCHAEVASLRNMYHNCFSNTFGKFGKQIKVGYQ